MQSEFWGERIRTLAAAMRIAPIAAFGTLSVALGDGRRVDSRTAVEGRAVIAKLLHDAANCMAIATNRIGKVPGVGSGRGLAVRAVKVLPIDIPIAEILTGQFTQPGCHIGVGPHSMRR